MSLQSELQRTTAAISRAWTEAIETMLSTMPGVTPTTHTLVTVNTDDGGMMAWACPLDAVSNVPRFPRVVLKRSTIDEMNMRYEITLLSGAIS